VDYGFAPQCARAAPILSMIKNANKVHKVPKRAQEKQARNDIGIGIEAKDVK
jgi:hypothetical protein